MRPRDDGFTRSTALHSHGPEVNTTTTLRRLEPYVARSQRGTFTVLIVYRESGCYAWLPQRPRAYPHLDYRHQV